MEYVGVQWFVFILFFKKFTRLFFAPSDMCLKPTDGWWRMLYSYWGCFDFYHNSVITQKERLSFVVCLRMNIDIVKASIACLYAIACLGDLPLLLGTRKDDFTTCFASCSYFRLLVIIWTNCLTLMLQREHILWISGTSPGGGQNCKMRTANYIPDGYMWPTAQCYWRRK